MTRNDRVIGLVVAFVLTGTTGACGPWSPSLSERASGSAATTDPEGLPALVDIPTYRVDTAGSLEMPGPGPTGKPRVGWQRSDLATGESFSPILVDGKLVVPDGHNTVYALDARTGKSIWQYDSLADPPPGQFFTGWVSAADDAIFVADREALHAIDLATGQRRWREATPNAMSSPRVLDGVAYQGSVGAVVGFDVGTGNEVWRWDDAPPELSASPFAIGNGVMYIGVDDGRMYAIGLDGEERGFVQTRGVRPTTPTLTPQSAYFGARQIGAEPAGELFAVERQTHDVRWSFPSPSRTQINAGPVRDGVIFASTEDDGIFALRDEGSTWAEAWHASDAPRSYFPLSIAGEVLYHQRYDGSLGAYAVDDGALLWETPALGGNGGGAPLVSGGMVFSVVAGHGPIAYADDDLIARLDLSTPQPPPTSSLTPAIPDPFAITRSFPWQQVGIKFPLGMDAGPDAMLYVLDTRPAVVVIDPANGRVVRSWGEQGSDDGQFDLRVVDDNPGIGDIAVARDGHVYVVDGSNYRVQVFAPNGTYLDQFGGFGARDGQFRAPAEITISPDGNVFVLDSERVTKFTPDGEFVWRSPDPAGDEDLSGWLHGIAVRADGDVLLTCEFCPHSIIVLDGGDGKVAERWDEPTLHGAQLTIDSAGRIYAEEWGTATLYLLAPDGTVMGARALGPGDMLTGLGGDTDWGDSFWPVPVPLPDGRAFTFNKLGLVELAVGIP